MSTILTWYGHATLGLTIDKYRLLVDPFFTGNPAAAATAAPTAAATRVCVSISTHARKVYALTQKWAHCMPIPHSCAAHRKRARVSRRLLRRCPRPRAAC